MHDIRDHLEKEYQKINRWGKWLGRGFLLVISLAVIFATLYLYHAYHNWAGADGMLDGMSKVGDALGGILGAVFGAFGFVALLYTIYLQQYTIKVQMQELKDSNEQLKESAEAQKQMEQTQRLAQFESLFTQMNRQLNYLHDALEDSHLDDILTTLYQHPTWTLVEIKIYLNQQSKLVRMMIYLSQVLKLINKSTIDHHDRLRYFGFVRSSIDDRILRLLCLHYANLPDTQDGNHLNYTMTHELLEQSEFFMNLSFGFFEPNGTIPMLIAIAHDVKNKGTLYYNPKAFGKNRYLRLLDDCHENDTSHTHRG